MLLIKQLKVTHFKNYEHEQFEFSPHFNCLVGRNGMGKTNLLDAIYYLCMGKSYFIPNDRHLKQHGADFFRLEGLFERQDHEERIVVKVIPQKRKEVERNGVAYQRLSDHVGLLPVVIIIPDDTLLATEGSEERRRFLDNTISQFDPAYLRHLIQYNKVVRQRNAALRQMAANGGYRPSLIEVYDQQMIEPATYVYEQRRVFVTQFNPLLQDMYARISAEAEEASCRYRSHLDQQEASLVDLLAQAREKDRILQRTTVGIHRDDLIFRLDGHPLKRFASQGQLKSYILALKLGQYELMRLHKNQLPLLLLDDIFDKLDQQRVDQLLSLLAEGDYGQIFITDTDERRISRMIARHQHPYREFHITNGTAKPL